MPPTRTPAPAKPVKTERTHEENQERAYIAASRRSDRSLEARVESARRASEIHKRRTGRGLKVTEQDVINEEMYEEEDDDLPLAYRRLTAHIQTNHPEFNRRLSAYLTANVAMRSALEQSIQTSYQQSYNGAPQPYQASPQQQLPNINTQWDMFQSPMYAHQQQQQQQQQQPHRPNMMPSSPSYRQAPYPTPNSNSQGFQTTHQRSQSFASPQNFTPNSSTQSPILSQPDNTRRMSLPVNTVASPDSSTPGSTGSGTVRAPRPRLPPGSINTASQDILNDANRFKQANEVNTKTEPQVKMETNSGANLNASLNDIWPLTTNLPANMQAFMPGSFGFPNDPLTNNLMMGSQMNNDYYDSSVNFGQTNPTLSGLTSTLTGQATGDDSDSNLTANYFNDAFMGTKGVSGTPGDETWNQFMDDSAWDVLPSSQKSQ